MTRFNKLIAALAVAFVGGIPQPSWSVGPASFVIITAPGSADFRVSKAAVGRIFTRKQTFWDNGTRIHPVNLPASNPHRRSFSQTFLGGHPEDQEGYWREMYFLGVLPPHVLASEEAVVIFVESTPGAIGYLSSCVPGARVNVALVVGDVPNCAK